MTLKGKVAIVTGSTSGIGLGIARQFAEAGADVLLNGFGDAGEIEHLRRDIADECGVRTTYSGAECRSPIRSPAWGYARSLFKSGLNPRSHWPSVRKPGECCFC